MKSDIQLKYSNDVAFSHFHGCAVNNLGLMNILQLLDKYSNIPIDRSDWYTTTEKTTVSDKKESDEKNSKDRVA